MRTRAWLLFSSVLPVLGFGAGCGSDVPSFPEPERDGGLECGSAPSTGDAASDADGGAAPGTCASGEVCLAGRCYATCESDQQCARTQMCMGGVCVAGERPDASPPPDAGPPDPCDMVMCETEDAPVCSVEEQGVDDHLEAELLRCRAAVERPYTRWASLAAPQRWSSSAQQGRHRGQVSGAG